MRCNHSTRVLNAMYTIPIAHLTYIHPYSMRLCLFSSHFFSSLSTSSLSLLLSFIFPYALLPLHPPSDFLFLFLASTSSSFLSSIPPPPRPNPTYCTHTHSSFPSLAYIPSHKLRSVAIVQLYAPPFQIGRAHV